MKPLRILLAAATFILATGASAAFDQSHAAWDALLKKHVKVIDGGKASQVRYADFAKDRPVLKAWLALLPARAGAEFAAESCSGVPFALGEALVAAR